MSSLGQEIAAGLNALELLQNVFAIKRAIVEVHGPPGPPDVVEELEACERRLDELFGKNRTIEVRLPPRIKHGLGWRDMRIVAAAVMFDQWIYTMPPPGRHWNIVHFMNEKLGIAQDYRSEQGFLTDTGDFVRRKPAFRIAKHAGQIIARSDGKTYDGPDLYSEDVW